MPRASTPAAFAQSSGKLTTSGRWSSGKSWHMLDSVGMRSSWGDAEDANRRQSLSTLKSPSGNSLRTLSRSTTTLAAAGGSQLLEKQSLGYLEGGHRATSALGAKGSTSNAEVNVDDTIRKHLDACKDQTRAIEMLLESRAKHSMHLEEAGAVDEEAERRQQLEERRKKLFRDRQKARDPYRRVMLRLEDARAEDGAPQAASGARPSTFGTLGSVPMMVIGSPSDAGKEPCHIVDLRKLQSKSQSLGKGMSVEDLLELKKSREKDLKHKPSMNKSASFTMTPDQRLKRMQQVRSRNKVCQLMHLMRTLNRMKGEVPVDEYQRLREEAASTLQASIQSDDECGFLRAWFQQLGASDEIAAQLRYESQPPILRYWRRVRGVLRTWIVFSAFARKANRAAEVVKLFLRTPQLAHMKEKLLAKRQLVVQGCTRFLDERGQHRQEMLQQWQEVEDRILSSWAQQVLARRKPSQDASGSGRDVRDASALAEETCRIAENWTQLRISEETRASLLDNYYNARFRRDCSQHQTGYQNVQTVGRISRASQVRSSMAHSGNSRGSPSRGQRGKPRGSALQNRAFWDMRESEIIELVALGARKLRLEPPFTMHPANCVSNELQQASEGSQGWCQVVGPLHVDSDEPSRQAPEESLLKVSAWEDSVREERRLPAMTPARAQAVDATTSTYSGDAAASTNLEDLMASFTPRVCWQSVMDMGTEITAAGSEQKWFPDTGDHNLPGSEEIVQL
eukprot:TRINITY_DN42525_c0_g1_i1.p1 TRINITY_DN42525_c0_g1~~TRINITY_DN42525_c0_g1_i1.p1  ORF type:complete len:738 (+),score=143.48 TRINITY_DN42525_c0_g1_i1:54-2267(+)